MDMSSRTVRIGTGAAAAALAVALIASGSAVSLPLRSGDASRIRLSWSARPERIETCRALSEAEIAAQPEHMRREVECEGKFATYALEVTIDGRVVEQTAITGGGLRSDRPVHYLHDFDVPGGEHAFHLSLERRETSESAGREGVVGRHDDDDDDDDDHDDDRRELEAGRSERERIERRRREETALPPSLALDTTLVIQPGQVAIVTFDPANRTFGFISRQASAP